MKTKSLLLTAILLPVALQAQMDLGSTGSYGALNITSNTTLVVPDDGIFNCTTITMTGGILTFTPNARNTPVYLLAQGDVLITGGQINVSGQDRAGLFPGQGGPGGYAGGMASSGGQPPANGNGPGGGIGGQANGDGGSNAGSGAYGSRGNFTKNGAIYGNPLLIPLIGGSGGGGAGTYNGGGGGGGAILIASNTLVSLSSMSILARGGYGDYYNPGSGGAIRIVAPTVVVPGSVALDTLEHANGSAGRIRIDAINRTVNPAYFEGAMSVGSNLVVFPQNMPSLRIVNAAGQAVDPNLQTPLLITVPPGSPTTQPVTVKAEKFGGTAQVTVVLTPEFGDRTTYNLDIANPGPDAVEASVNVTFPVNITTRVDVWTR